MSRRCTRLNGCQLQPSPDVRTGQCRVGEGRAPKVRERMHSKPRFTLLLLTLLAPIRVIIDSSARRFQAHKIYLRAAAARRWAMSRANILHGHPSPSQRAAALKTASTTLRHELAHATDEHVVADLRAADLRAGHWLEDDPPLSMIQHWIHGRR